MAIVGYKLDLVEFGNAAVDAMQALQQPTGGFLGSYGPGADYGPNGELSWACKYLLDACHWRMRTTFARQRERFQTDVPAEDPRRDAILEAIGDLGDGTLLEVGCGKGRFLRMLRERDPAARLTGVDVAQELLEYLPDGVEGHVGSMLSLPFPSGTFDVVVCIEALEHAVRIERAVAEMSRVLKPTGTLVIVDKSIEHLGRLHIEPWEQWFDPAALSAMLESHGFSTTVRSLQVQNHDPAAALRVWHGRRAAGGGHLPNLARVNRPGRPRSHVLHQYQKAKRRACARSLAEQAFAKYEAGDLVSARPLLLRALALDLPTWLANRGVVSILVESFVGPALIRGVRRRRRAH